MPPSLSIVILTHDSERYLDEVLASASFADEVLILDGGSTDRTLDIARRHGARIEEQSEWLGFGRQKQRAVDLATHDWVFVLDSDEVILPGLREEILSTLQDPQGACYLVPRLNYFFGKPIRHGGLYPDATIRLFDRKKGRFTPDKVHEKVLVDGPVASLHHPMKHYAYETIEQFIDKQNRYSTLGAKSDRLKAILNPWWTFFRMYVLKSGFLDGWEGYLIARLYAQYTFWKYIKKDPDG
ncbi:glycosyltransferase family 2 protein [Nitratifractor sp.]